MRKPGRQEEDEHNKCEAGLGNRDKGAPGNEAWTVNWNDVFLAEGLHAIEARAREFGGGAASAELPPARLAPANPPAYNTPPPRLLMGDAHQ